MIIRRWFLKFDDCDYTVVGSIQLKAAILNLTAYSTMKKVEFLYDSPESVLESIIAENKLSTRPAILTLIKNIIEGNDSNIIENFDNFNFDSISEFLNIANPEEKERKVKISLEVNQNTHDFVIGMYKPDFTSSLDYRNDCYYEAVTHTGTDDVIASSTFYNFLTDENVRVPASIMRCEAMFFDNKDKFSELIRHKLSQLKLKNFIENSTTARIALKCWQGDALPSYDDDLNWEELFKKIISVLSMNSDYNNEFCKKLLNLCVEKMQGFPTNLNLSTTTIVFNEVGLEPFEKEFVLLDDLKIKLFWNGTVLTTDKEICPQCGRIVDTIFVDEHQNKMCFDCLKNSKSTINSRIIGYHSGTVFNVQPSIGDDSASSRSRYGFELELIRNTTTESREWLDQWMEEVGKIIYGNGHIARLERDGSLPSNGEEMISQPLNKTFILSDKIKELFNGIGGLYYQNNRCGLHLHVDANALTDAQWGKMIAFISKHYQNFVEAGVFRPTNGYNSLDALNYSVQNASEPLEIYREFLRRNSHYSSVSKSRSTSKTIEFRCFDSTTDYDTFIKAVKVIMCLMDNIDQLYEYSLDSSFEMFIQA